MVINMTGVQRYDSKEKQVVTTISACQLSEVQLLRDLSVAIETNQNLTLAIINMKKKLAEFITDD